MAEEKKKSSGCLKSLGIGCGVVLVLVVIGGLFVALNIKPWIQKGGAFFIEVAAENILSELGFPEEEKRATLEPIRSFAEDFRGGRIQPEQVGKVAKEVFSEKIVVAVGTKGFELSYLETVDLTPVLREAARITLSRFTHGVLEERIPTSRIEQVFELISEETGASRWPDFGAQDASTDSFDGRRLKENLTADDVLACLGVMKQAADEAGIAIRRFEIDLPGEIRRAIEQGMAAAEDQ